jgi:hypothetical protein
VSEQQEAEIERAEEIIATSQPGWEASRSVPEEQSKSITEEWYPVPDSLTEDRRAFRSIEVFEWINLNVQVLAPNVAHVTTRWESSATNHAGSPVTHTGRWTGVWLNRDGEWYEILGHSSGP